MKYKTHVKITRNYDSKYDKYIVEGIELDGIVTSSSSFEDAVSNAISNFSLLMICLEDTDDIGEITVYDNCIVDDFIDVFKESILTIESEDTEEYRSKISTDGSDYEYDKYRHFLELLEGTKSIFEYIIDTSQLEQCKNEIDAIRHSSGNNMSALSVICMNNLSVMIDMILKCSGSSIRSINSMLKNPEEYYDTSKIEEELCDIKE